MGGGGARTFTSICALGEDDDGTVTKVQSLADVGVLDENILGPHHLP